MLHLPDQLFVAGIGTGVGKTVVAAALVRHMRADYWKPVQSGDLHQTDSMKVAEWVGLQSVVHSEKYRLTQPLSPHASAAIDEVNILLSDFTLPSRSSRLVVEGAGGLLVPLNKTDLLIDLITHLGLPVVLVVRHYLGSINHTLLSCNLLAQRKVPVAGIVISGTPNKSSEEAIFTHTYFPLLGRVPELATGQVPIFIPNVATNE